MLGRLSSSWLVINYSVVVEYFSCHWLRWWGLTWRDVSCVRDVSVKSCSRLLWVSLSTKCGCRRDSTDIKVSIKWHSKSVQSHWIFCPNSVIVQLFCQSSLSTTQMQFKVMVIYLGSDLATFNKKCTRLVGNLSKQFCLKKFIIIVEETKRLMVISYANGTERGDLKKKTVKAEGRNAKIA